MLAIVLLAGAASCKNFWPKNPKPNIQPITFLLTKLPSM